MFAAKRKKVMVKEKSSLQKKKARCKRKAVAAKENNSREKEKDLGKRKIVATKESNSQKKRKNTTKGHEKYISKNKILKKEKKIFCKFV